MEGSEEESKWGRSANSQGFNLNAPYIPSSPSFVVTLRGNTIGTSSSRNVEVENYRDEMGIRQNRERLDLWGDLQNPALPRRSPKKSSGSDVSLREWLDKPERMVELVECLHIFRQVVDMVSIAHAQGVVVSNVRPSCLVMSSLNRVSFIESASCSTSEPSSGSGSCDGERGRESSRGLILCEGQMSHVEEMEYKRGIGESMVIEWQENS